ncbi:unnamed protein product [Merluccius merluccius]
MVRRVSLRAKRRPREPLACGLGDLVQSRGSGILGPPGERTPRLAEQRGGEQRLCCPQRPRSAAAGWPPALTRGELFRL